VIYGSIVALRQKDLKKLLAYSSLAHVGLIAAGAYTLRLMVCVLFCK
jgi:NADH-quinone oxidoreductase subunit M